MEMIVADLPDVKVVTVELPEKATDSFPIGLGNVFVAVSWMEAVIV